MKVRLATFNLENLDSGPKASAPVEARFSVLRPQLARLNADVLCFQEVNAQRILSADPRSLDALNQLLADSPYQNFHRLGTAHDDGSLLDKHNLVIISRWPFLERRQIKEELLEPPLYQTRVEPDAGAKAVGWDRPLLAGLIEFPTMQRLWVVNLHLRAPLAAALPGEKSGSFSWNSVSGWAEGFFLASMKRNGQALEARLFVEEVLSADPDALVAVCGDLNAESEEVPLRILRADLDDTGNGALSGKVLTPLERVLPDWRRFSVIHAGRKTMLDHILASRNLLNAFSTIEVHNEALGDELSAYACVGQSPESYHAPLVAEFDILDAD